MSGEMYPIVYVVVFAGVAILVAHLGIRFACAGRKRTGETIVVVGLLLAIFGVAASHRKASETTAGKLGGAFVVLEDRMRDGDQLAALEIVDRAIRFFGASTGNLDQATEDFWEFAIKYPKGESKALGPR